MEKKQKTLQKKKKKNIKYFLKVKQVLSRDIIERCKLPEVIELRKKLGYNLDEIMVWEETSIAEKIKLFPKEDIELNKNI